MYKYIYKFILIKAISNTSMIIEMLKIFIEISELMNKHIYKKFELINKKIQNFVLIKN